MYIFCFVCFRHGLFSHYYEYFRMTCFSRCPYLLFPTLKSSPRLGVLQGPFPSSPPFPLTFSERVPQPPRRRLVSIRFIVDR